MLSQEVTDELDAFVEKALEEEGDSEQSSLPSTSVEVSGQPSNDKAPIAASAGAGFVEDYQEGKLE